MEKEDVTHKIIGCAYQVYNNYLMATGIEVGLLINFGSTGVDVKRKYRTAKGKQ